MISRHTLIAQPAPQLQEPLVHLSLQLSSSLQFLKQRITPLAEPYSCCVLFFTVTAQGAQECVFFVRRATLEAAWREGTTRVRQWAWMRQLSAVELRIEWPIEIVSIGDRIPPLCQWGPASTWALADDGLEHAEFLPSVALPDAGADCLQSWLKSCARAAAFPALAEVNLLMRLEGLHVDGNGVQTELPGLRPHGCRGPCGLHQRHAGACSDERCDRLCVSYALLLARHHAAHCDATRAGLIQALELAFACLEKNLGQLRAQIDASYIKTAMCLLIFTRYLSSREMDGAFVRLAHQVERLASALEALNNTTNLVGNSQTLRG
ncbi:hypothetical protein [Comamonas endophytica]|uniref:Uncharacterized protein n=1 Tax=Comamonas endophytica TaxID=2949090 RepID=A0ABY6GB21_9BURK|nr:hypothetical protein [Acidovorax sp. 5MLIR]UYG51915.1 hypothetical protein M9799_01290 [Acidovorax sp. 5MLIR]